VAVICFMVPPSSGSGTARARRTRHAV